MIDPTDPELADLLDVVTAAGKASPGLVDFPKPGDSPRKWDERQGVGLSGATIVFTGLGVAKFTTRLTLWLPEHFRLWDEWKPIVAPPAQGTRPRIVDIYHPFLAEVGIGAAGVENRTQLAPVSELGDWFVDIMWLSYRKPLPALGTGKGAQATQYKNNSANDSGDAQIAALAAQLKGLIK